MPDERNGLAKGIPQVIRTRERWPTVIEMVQRSSQTAPPVRPLEQDFETIEEFLEAENEFIENLIDFKIEQCFKAERTLTQRTNDAQATRGATAGLFTQFFPREQPGRSKVFSVPLVGPAASRFVGSQYLAFEENEELNQALIEQGDEKVRLNRQAEEIHEKWKQLPGMSYPSRQFVKDEGGDAATLAKVNDIIRDETLGLDYGDRLIKQLQVGNGQRARYIASQLEGKSESEKKEYLSDLKRKKIITPKVNQQLREEPWKRRRD